MDYTTIFWVLWTIASLFGGFAVISNITASPPITVITNLLSNLALSVLSHHNHLPKLAFGQIAYAIGYVWSTIPETELTCNPRPTELNKLSRLNMTMYLSDSHCHGEISARDDQLSGLWYHRLVHTTTLLVVLVLGVFATRYAMKNIITYLYNSLLHLITPLVDHYNMIVVLRTELARGEALSAQLETANSALLESQHKNRSLSEANLIMSAFKTDLDLCKKELEQSKAELGRTKADLKFANQLQDAEDKRWKAGVFGPLQSPTRSNHKAMSTHQEAIEQHHAELEGARLKHKREMEAPEKAHQTELEAALHEQQERLRREYTRALEVVESTRVETLKQHEASSANLHQQTESHQSNVAQMQAQIDNANAQSRKLHEQLEEVSSRARAELLTKTKQLSEVQSQLSSKDQELQDATSQARLELLNRTRQLSEVQSRLSSKDQELQDASSQARITSDNLNLRISELDHQISVKDAEFKAKYLEFSNTNSELPSKKQELQEESHELAKSHAKILVLQAQIRNGSQERYGKVLKKYGNTMVTKNRNTKRKTVQSKSAPEENLQVTENGSEVVQESSAIKHTDVPMESAMENVEVINEEVASGVLSVQPEEQVRNEKEAMPSEDVQMQSQATEEVALESASAQDVEINHQFHTEDVTMIVDTDVAEADPISPRQSKRMRSEAPLGEMEEVEAKFDVPDDTPLPDIAIQNPESRVIAPTRDVEMGLEPELPLGMFPKTQTKPSRSKDDLFYAPDYGKHKPMPTLPPRQVQPPNYLREKPNLKRGYGEEGEEEDQQAPSSSSISKDEIALLESWRKRVSQREAYIKEKNLDFPESWHRDYRMAFVQMDDKDRLVQELPALQKFFKAMGRRLGKK